MHTSGCLEKERKASSSSVAPESTILPVSSSFNRQPCGPVWLLVLPSKRCSVPSLKLLSTALHLAPVSCRGRKIAFKPDLPAFPGGSLNPTRSPADPIPAVPLGTPSPCRAPSGLRIAVPAQHLTVGPLWSFLRDVMFTCDTGCPPSTWLWTLSTPRSLLSCLLGSGPSSFTLAFYNIASPHIYICS